MDNASRLLCVDTSSFFESVALTRGHTIVAQKCVERRGGHGPGILDDIAALLAETGWSMTELDGFACGLGPGGFTGLRIGLSTVKAFSMAFNRPVFGARTTQLLRAAIDEPLSVAVIDARRDQVYLEAAHLSEPVCCNPDELRAYLDQSASLVFVGDGALRYATKLNELFPHATISPNDADHRAQAGLLPHCIDFETPASLTTLEPVYIRKSDAEIKYPDGFPDAQGHRGQGRSKP